MEGFDIHAATDVTGFGLLGHAARDDGGVGARRRSSRSPRVPLLSQARRLVGRGRRAGRLAQQRAATCGPRAEVAEGVSDDDFLLVCDAQTSGGLLVALPQEQAEAYAARCRERGAPAGAVDRTRDREGPRAAARDPIGKDSAMADETENEDEWVEVAAVGDDEEAEIIAGLLESEDIPCEIEGAVRDAVAREHSARWDSRAWWCRPTAPPRRRR